MLMVIKCIRYVFSQTQLVRLYRVRLPWNTTKEKSSIVYSLEGMDAYYIKMLSISQVFASSII